MLCESKNTHSLRIFKAYGAYILSGSLLLKQADSAVSTGNLNKILSPSPTKNNFHKTEHLQIIISTLNPRYLKKKNQLNS